MKVMIINLVISIKFRAFLFTITTIKKHIIVSVEVAQKKLAFTTDDMVTVPAGARVLYDDHGVSLAGWL